MEDLNAISYRIMRVLSLNLTGTRKSSISYMGYRPLGIRSGHGNSKMKRQGIETTLHHCNVQGDLLSMISVPHFQNDIGRS